MRVVGGCITSGLVALIAIFAFARAGEIKEYCERESFQASCEADKVILMTSAMYGRMKLGHCVKTDYGSLGCSENVLPYVHSMCSGRRECEFLISDLHSARRCPAELLSYLEASYDCIPVATCSSSLCKAGSYLRVPSTSGYIGGITTSETGCGSQQCPWTVQPEDGQRVNLTFYYFQSPSTLMMGGSHCHRHASVVDKKTNVAKDMTVCDGGKMVVSYATTESAAAEIIVYSGGQNQPSNFLIHYEVTGCPAIAPPEGAKVVRDGDKLTVACQTTARSWHLTCAQSGWVGEIGLCDPSEKTAAWTITDGGTSPQGLAMVVGIGVALGVLLGFTLLGLAVFCMRRHRRNHYQRPDDIVRFPPEADKGYEIKIYDQGLTPKTLPTPDSGYYTGTNYQPRQPPSLAPGNMRHVMTSPKNSNTGLAQHPVNPGQTYFQSIGSAEVPFSFRDHVYESPHFKQQEDTHSVTTAASN